MTRRVGLGVGERVVVEHGHHQLGDEPRVALRVARAPGDPRRAASSSWRATRSVKCCVAWVISSGKSWCSRQCSAVTKRGPMPAPSLPTDRTALGDVEVQPGDRIRAARAAASSYSDAALGDQVLEHREEQLVLAGEDPVEGLERDAGLLDQLLGREALAAFGDQPARGVDDRPWPAPSAGPASAAPPATGRRRARPRAARDAAAELTTVTARRPGSRGRCGSGTRRSWATPRSRSARGAASRSSDAVRAVTGMRSPFTWISAAGFAVRLRYHDGCFGAPPIDATTR